MSSSQPDLREGKSRASRRNSVRRRWFRSRCKEENSNGMELLLSSHLCCGPLPWLQDISRKSTLCKVLLVLLGMFRIVTFILGTQEMRYELRVLTGETNYESALHMKPHAVRLHIDGNVEGIDLRQFSIREEPKLPARRQVVSHPTQKKKQQCEQMYDWQTIFYPTCNGMHETSFSHIRNDNLRLVAHGFIRDVYELKAPDGTRWALKTNRIETRFSEYHLQGQINDAIIAERASFSKHVANIYGVCGFSSLYEFSEEGTLKQHYKHLDRGETLRAAFQISRGLADVHTLGGGDYSPFTDLDIAARQFVKLHDRFQLNDFNSGLMMNWDRENRRTCKLKKMKMGNMNRAPEEFRDKWNMVDEKIDVYSLGNIFYQLLTKHVKYKYKEWRDIEKLILAGDIPKLPDGMEESTDTVVVALKTAMHMSLVLDPETRASAKQVADYLEDQLKVFDNEKAVGHNHERKDSS